MGRQGRVSSLSTAALAMVSGLATFFIHRAVPQDSLSRFCACFSKKYLLGRELPKKPGT